MRGCCLAGVPHVPGGAFQPDGADLRAEQLRTPGMVGRDHQLPRAKVNSPTLKAR